MKKFITYISIILFTVIMFGEKAFSKPIPENDPSFLSGYTIDYYKNIKFYLLQDKIVLSFNNETGNDVEIRIYDVTGSLVVIKKTDGNESDVYMEFETSLFPKGIYIVQINNTTAKTSRKFYVQ